MLNNSSIYDLQNRAIHKARAELEAKGVLEKGRSMEACRFLAGKVNLGVQSISNLDLKQREQLINMLIEMGATVRNPHIYPSDLHAEGSRWSDFPHRKNTSLGWSTRSPPRSSGERQTAISASATRSSTPRAPEILEQ